MIDIKRFRAVSLLSVMLLAVSVPLLRFNFQLNYVLWSENRLALSPPQVLTDDGSFNPNFVSEFTSYFSDNIGFRVSFSM
ncbi:MAG TPA: hypothetical protein GX523_09750 [Desulfitobacterium dehalogenans]|uniref:Uncharacterized protein n=1 Tax=Desulfitobacterium dehalogenans TaxID=36854 RepID=A0A7C7D5W1_9FIRM|nr:hypothetical protein [Desulfitobacterium dehalogenans]